MYEVYTTKAFVIGFINKSENDRIYRLLTLEYGTILAVASGVRKQESKLKAHLTNYGVIDVSLVRGKEFWKIVSCQKDVVWLNLWKDLFLRKMYAQIFSLIKRLIIGEEKNSEIFSFLFKSFVFLDKECPNLSLKEYKTFEEVIALNILYRLGYVKIPDKFKKIMCDSINKQVIQIAENYSLEIIKIVNFGIKQSQL